MLTVDLFSSNYIYKLLVSRIQPLFLVALSPANPTHGYSTMFPDGRHVHFVRLVYTVFYV